MTAFQISAKFSVFYSISDAHLAYFNHIWQVFCVLFDVWHAQQIVQFLQVATWDDGWCTMPKFTGGRGAGIWAQNKFAR